ncbi:hypothetical protein AB0L82_35830 [Nocardia sp. NPDC052001]|uniref:hypothetical protein n=1 Tax=Nocardia sp. NPDC052001 TaxID=3154853 RepID=UPI0034340C4D
MELTIWDVVPQKHSATALLSTYWYKNEHHGRPRPELDRQIMDVVFETRKRTMLGNDTHDQASREFHLREARARMN